jgi:TPR repeat protein
MIVYKRFIVIPAFLLSLVSMSVAAASLKEVGEAIRAKDYKSAIEQLEVMTKQQHPEAEFLMGMMYEYGRGVEQDFVKAANWFRRSAEQGNVAAQTNLALLYVNGKAGKTDYKEAVRLLEKAAATGSATAIYNLGLRYAKGEGVEKNPEKAAELYRKAAEKNDPFAQYNLSYAYAKGDGVPVDNIEALKWARLSAQQNFGRALVFHNFLASKATPEELQKSEVSASDWGKEKGIEMKPLPKIEVQPSATQGEQGKPAEQTKPVEQPQP